MSSGQKKIVGVLGGMGPDATVDFMATVIAMTDAKVDQDHVHLLVDHNPQVPDRQAALRGDDAGVRKALVDMARRLQAAGADALVMPCNTAHVFVADLLAAVSVPFFDIIEATVSSLDDAARAVGVLATSACIESAIYQDALSHSGRRTVLPDEDDQRQLMQLIFDVKSGDRGPERRRDIAAIAKRLTASGAQAVIAGCTEIPLVLRPADVDVPCVSSTAALAERTIAFAQNKQ